MKDPIGTVLTVGVILGAVFVAEHLLRPSTGANPWQGQTVIPSGSGYATGTGANEPTYYEGLRPGGLGY